MKKVMLAVSFGVSCPEAERKCIRPVEAALAQAFVDYDIHRAYTSRVIVQKLRAQGVAIEGEAEAITRLRAEGCGEIAIVSTHILPGEEYERTLRDACSCPVSEPLLANDDDLDWMAALLEGIAVEEDRPLVLMGHGTAHSADAIYARLRDRLPENVYLACIDGAHRLEELLPQLEALPGRRLTLMPLMLVAGSHARDVMAGKDETSWKSMLEARGLDVRIRMQGLGALAQVQQRFVEKARRMLGEQRP